MNDFSMAVDRFGDLDYKVADLSLADFGRKEIKIAAANVPAFVSGKALKDSVKS